MAGLGRLFLAGARLQASHRAALISGIATNAVFGAVRSAVFLTIYAAVERRGDATVAGLARADALTYVWVVQATIAVMWAPWVMELPVRIRSGEWTAELTRPGSLLARHAAFDLGRSLAMLALRAPVPLIGAGIALHLHLPTTVPGGAALLASLVLAAVAASAVRFLFGAVAFWSPDFRGVYSALFGPVYFVSGFVIPVEYLPGLVADIARFGPLVAVLTAPVAVATGRDVVEHLALQVLWLAGLWWCGAAVLRRATRHLVVFGG